MHEIAKLGRVGALCLLATACSGQVFPSGSRGGSETHYGPGAPARDLQHLEECQERSVARQPLRRLSSTQYHNTLRDLFGAQLAEPFIVGSLFPPTQITAGFTNDAEANVVNTTDSYAIEDNAQRIAGIILEDPDSYLRALLPCELPETIRDADIEGCIDAFVTEFGRRAYRRPLTEAEAGLLRGLFDEVRAEQSAREAWAALVQFFVQAPALLYRVERGADEVMAGVRRLSDYEMASRLSYFFLDSMPDETLLVEAEAGRLSMPEQVAEQARRLVESPRIMDVLEQFHRDWLHLNELEQLTKDTNLFPQYDEALRRSLLRETRELIHHVLYEGDGSVRSLLGGEQIPVDAALADLYQVSVSLSDGDEWAAVEVPNRRGLLTQASLMAVLAEADHTSPIHRGVFFQREVFCNAMPAFPGDADTSTPLQDTSMLPTARERLEPLLTRPECSNCHRLFNPTGYAFESYDPIGRYREIENGASIDTSGSIDLGDGMQSFETPWELVELAAESEKVRDCYSMQWYRSATGRRDVPQDACGLALVREASAQSEGDIREMLVALTQTDAFLYLRESEE